MRVEFPWWDVGRLTAITSRWSLVFLVAMYKVWRVPWAMAASTSGWLTSSAWEGSGWSIEQFAIVGVTGKIQLCFMPVWKYLDLFGTIKCTFTFSSARRRVSNYKIIANSYSLFIWWRPSSGWVVTEPRWDWSHGTSTEHCISQGSSRLSMYLVCCKEDWVGVVGWDNRSSLENRINELQNLVENIPNHPVIVMDGSEPWVPVTPSGVLEVEVRLNFSVVSWWTHRRMSASWICIRTEGRGSTPESGSHLQRKFNADQKQFTLTNCQT